MGERKPYFLLFVVFISGLAVMAVEMSASRLLAPYFGTSLFVWTNLIGVTMIALTVGYYGGGSLADRHPRAPVLYWLLFIAGVLVTAIPFTAHPVMQFAVRAIDNLDTSLFLWSLFATIAQFFIPLLILGMTAPFAIRICTREIRTVGNTSGSIYALSNAGSIIGTFLPALLTIPLFGTKRTIIACGVVLMLTSAFGLRKKLVHLAVVPAALLLFLGPAVPTAGIIYEGESVYNFIQVAERSDGQRELRLNEGHAIHSLYNPKSVLVGGVWDYFSLIPLLKPDSERALIIGIAAGTISRAYAELYPNIAIDGVEIDPAILEVGERYFAETRAAQPLLNPIAADGRTFLKKSDAVYDLIFIDAYKQPYIPFYLVTQEFFTEVKEHLTPGGIAAINVGSPSPKTDILWAIANTMASVFRSVTVIAVQGSFNYVVIASDTPYRVEELAQRTDLDPRLSALAQQLPGRTGQVDLRDSLPVFTDDHAPVEFFTEKMIIEYARG